MQAVDERLFTDLVSAATRVHENLDELKKAKPRSIKDMADRLFAVREALKCIKDMRSELLTVENLMERLLAAVYLSSSQTDDTIKTEYVTATPMPGQGTNVPKVGSAEYRSLLAHLGLNEEAVNHEVVKIHWPGWCSYYTALQARGDKLPIEPAEYDTTKVQTRKRQSIRGIDNV